MRTVPSYDLVSYASEANVLSRLITHQRSAHLSKQTVKRGGVEELYQSLLGGAELYSPDEEFLDLIAVQV